MRAGAAALLICALAACGATERDGEDAAAGSGGTAQAGASSAGTSSSGRGGQGNDCSNVGCGPPPLCETGCTALCGCCSCAEGQITDLGGTSYRCQGGCFAELDLQPVEWSLLQVNEGWGPCPDDNCSSQWVARPDGSLEVTGEGMTTSGDMAASDLAALEAIIAEPAFLEGMMQGFTCDPPPTDVGVSLRLELGDVEYTQTVTGCVLTGPEGNPAQRVVELLAQYWPWS